MEIDHGELTLYSDGSKPKGTLPEVLEILREYLPGIVPSALPFSTLRRFLRDARRNREEWRRGR
jgi:hypothetical protein